jgi:hypothetical protein
VIVFTTATSAGSTNVAWSWLKLKAECKARLRESMPVMNIITAEMSNSLDVEPNIPVSCDDAALKWWANNTGKYPHLSQVARVHLSISATSVSSERLFSKTGMIISERRTSLTPEHAEQIAFLSQNWHVV